MGTKVDTGGLLAGGGGGTRRVYACNLYEVPIQDSTKKNALYTMVIRCYWFMHCVLVNLTVTQSVPSWIALVLGPIHPASFAIRDSCRIVWKINHDWLVRNNKFAVPRKKIELCWQFLQFESTMMSRK